MKNIGIIGCGWLGKKIAQHLHQQYSIFATTTQEKSLAAMSYQVTSIVFSDETVQNINPMVANRKNGHHYHYNTLLQKKTPRSNIENRLTNLCTFIRGFKGQLFLMITIGIYSYAKVEVKEDT